MNSKHMEKCLVIMPFGKTDEERLISDLVYDNIIVPALKKAKVVGKRIDRELTLENLIQPTLLDELKNAPVVLADVSWNNPNVIFELGFRKAFGKSFVILSLNPKEAAWWIKGYKIIDLTKENAQQKITEHVKKAFNKSVEIPKVKSKLMEAASLSDQIIQQNPFVDRVAAWKVEKAIDEIKKINNRHTEYIAKKFTEYVGYNFSSILALMQPGETYFTISNIKFWSDDGVRNSSFLLENKHAAERGVVVKRIIIVEKDKFQKMMASKKESMYSVLKGHYDSWLSSGDFRKNIDIKILPVDDLGQALHKYSHFGLLINKTENEFDDAYALLITPRHERENLLAGIKLYFAERISRFETEIKKTFTNFNQAYLQDDIISIEDLFSGE